MRTYYVEGFQKQGVRFCGAHVFSKTGNNFLLGDKGCAILLSDGLVQSLADGEPDEALLFKLVQHGLAHIQGREPETCEKEILVRYFIIDLTSSCNFDCIYCFRSFTEHKRMDPDVLARVLAYIGEYCDSHGLFKIGVQMWGGEPLLEMDRIREADNYFRRCGIAASIDVETNASLVSDGMAKELSERGIHVGVSLDGPPWIQNRQRRFAGGGSSAEIVERGIRTLQKYYGRNLGGITVVTKYNYNHMAEILDYFIYKLGLTQMKFNFVRDNVNAREERLALTREEERRFLRDLTECLSAYHAMGAEFSEGNIAVRAKNLLERDGGSFCASRGCQGGKKMISFDTEGNIYPCEMTDFPEERIGTVFSGAPLDEQIRNAMDQNRFFTSKENEGCLTCPWRFFCRGGCSSRNRYLEKDGTPDETECLLNRILYPQIVEWILDGRFC